MKFPHRSGRRFAPRKTGDATPLGQLESAVMEVIWSRPEPNTVGDVHSAFPQDQPVAYNTVKTTMERLAEKGILSRLKVGKAYVYEVAVSRDELERRIVAGALDRLVEQFPEAVASFFVRPDVNISEAKLSLLREAVERQRRDSDG